MDSAVDFWNERWLTDVQEPLVDELTSAVSAIVDGLECSTVLDYGCGVGRWKPFWTDRGLIYTGYDFSQSAIELAPVGCGSELKEADIVFTCTVLIHSDDYAFDELAKHAASHIVCVESMWPHKPSTEYEHMRYRTMREFINLFPNEWHLHRATPVGKHHVLRFDKR